DARSAKTNQSSRRIVDVIVVQGGIVEVEDGSTGGAQANRGPRHLSHSVGIGLDKNGGKATGGAAGAIGADDQDCTAGAIHNRRGHDTGASTSFFPNHQV